MDTNTEFIHEFCKKHDIRDYEIDSDGCLNVYDRMVSIVDSDITMLPVKFNYVCGVFNLVTKNLTTLENCPKRVDDTFICEGNSLTTLKGTPMYVKNYYNIRRNKLTTLDYFPKYIGTSILISRIKLECNDQVFGVIHDILTKKEYPFYTEFEDLFRDVDMKNQYDIFVRMRTIKNIIE